ncbi:Beta-hexosaminidase A [Halotydeus destructor]|nr:Beta-hexosaminidase A [Halotydeus destructor]
MWSEFVDGSNIVSTLWPRASAPAERFWSSETTNNAYEAKPRLEQQRCRMQVRGVRVSPINGPGFCSCDHAVAN